MELLSLIAVMVYCSVSMFMAVRLLLLARKTRQLPEFMIGLAFLSGGMLGYPFSVAARVLAGNGRADAADVAHVLGQVGMALAGFFLLLSWLRIFAPSSRASAMFVVGWAGFMVVTLAMMLHISGPGSFEHLGTPTYWSMLFSQGGCYALLAWSSYQYSRKLKKRCAIGIGDPVVANRMLLWALSNVCITFSYIYATVVGVMLALGLPNIYHAVIVSGFGMLSAFFIALAFFPPQAYLARIRGDAEAQGA